MALSGIIAKDGGKEQGRYVIAHGNDSHSLRWNFEALLNRCDCAIEIGVCRWYDTTHNAIEQDVGLLVCESANKWRCFLTYQSKRRIKEIAYGGTSRLQGFIYAGLAQIGEDKSKCQMDKSRLFADLANDEDVLSITLMNMYLLPPTWATYIYVYRVARPLKLLTVYGIEYTCI